MAELRDVPLDPEVVNLLGQVHQAGLGDDSGQHQVVDVVLRSYNYSNYRDMVFNIYDTLFHKALIEKK